MRYCKKCVMPDTRPGITFDEEGVCCACRAYEKKQSTDWDQRFEELKNFAINIEIRINSDMTVSLL